jgi:hypothetical protein
MRKSLPTLLVAAALVAAALIAVGGSLSGPPQWSPDGLFYQARALEFQGVDRSAALQQTFQGPMGAELRRIDPTRSGSPSWVEFNAQFYERRITVPLAASVLEPVAGERTILDLSLAGYVVAILAIFGLLLLRFRLAIAGAVALGTAFLPALVHHSSYPLTDSWGLALEAGALACGLLVLQRGSRWLIPWTLLILLLSLTRDSTWIPIFAAAWLTVTLRSKVAVSLLGTALAVTIPVTLLFPTPMRELLAQMLNDTMPAPDPSWGFIASHYPGAVVDLIRANGGFVRDGAFVSAAYFGAGLIALFALARGRAASASTSFLKAAAVAAVGFVFVVPIYSAFRLELAVIPMAAFGLALAAERVAERLALPRLARSHSIAGSGSSASA